MKNSEQKEIELLIQNILSIIDIMSSSVSQFFTAYQNDDESGQMYYNDIVAGINCLRDNYAQIKPGLEHSYYQQMIENVDDTLYCLESAINGDRKEKAISLIQFQLQPFLQELKEELLFWGMIYPDKKKMKEYYAADFISHHENSYVKEKKLRFDVSLFIPVYNKLEYTKRCIDSILKHTDFNKYSCEWILINDGSTDGTKEYLESLNLEKVITFKENVKGSIFTTAFRVCEAKYFVFVNNDTVVTEGWLDNLIICAESDERIVSATPCTPNTSNLQGDYAERFPVELSQVEHYCNRSNPDYWEERSRIMPVIALYRSSVLNEIGFADRLFYTLEYWDDDFSLRARRAGYRQMICKDTYCYHFGSVTGAEAKDKNGTMELGKELFYYKTGVPAWSIGFGYDYFVIKHMYKNSVRRKGKIRLLGIDCGFGDTLIQLRDFFRSCGNETEVDSLTTDKRYLADLKPYVSNCIWGETMEQGVSQLEQSAYDYIYVSERIQTYEQMGEFLSLAHTLLKHDGILVFSISNLLYEPKLSLCMQGTFPWNEDSVAFVNPIRLQQQIEERYSKHKCIPIWGEEASEAVRGQIMAVERLIYYCTR